MSVVHLGLVGCGEMGRLLARECVASGRARVVAVSDPSAEALGQAANEFGAEPAADLEALLARSDLEAVLVAAPPAVPDPATMIDPPVQTIWQETGQGMSASLAPMKDSARRAFSLLLRDPSLKQ